MNYWKRQDEHDEVVRLRTILDIVVKDKTQMQSEIDQAANWGQSAKSDIKYLQGKFDQFAQTYSVENKRTKGSIE